MIITGLSVPIETALIHGGPIGAHAVPGNIVDGDTLLAVLHIEEGTPPDVAADLTAEFTITANKGGSITNTTTDTTGDFLLVVWAKAE